MSYHWRDGNRLQLLENGEEFFPRVFEVIAQAKKEVLLETFILFQDKVGAELQKALIAAAQNGASVDVTVDGYGSADLHGDFVAQMTQVGVRIHMFDPGKRLLGRRLNVFRRMHRKIVVVDGETAFIGGINFSADHLGDFGPAAKQDYALQVEGPVVRDIHHFALSQIAPDKTPRRWWRRRLRQQAPGYGGVSRGEARALFVLRDNDQHRNDIEEHYLQAIRDARSRLLIANAYFFPWLPCVARNTQRRAAGCAGAADPPGRAGHAHRQVRRAHALQLPDARRRWRYTSTVAARCTARSHWPITSGRRWARATSIR